MDEVRQTRHYPSWDWLNIRYQYMDLWTHFLLFYLSTMLSIGSFPKNHEVNCVFRRWRLRWRLFGSLWKDVGLRCCLYGALGLSATEEWCHLKKKKMHTTTICSPNDLFSQQKVVIRHRGSRNQVLTEGQRRMDQMWVWQQAFRLALKTNLYSSPQTHVIFFQSRLVNRCYPEEQVRWLIGTHSKDGGITYCYG